jgi:hypothetical protein
MPKKYSPVKVLKVRKGASLEEGGIVPKRHNGVKVLNVRKNASLREIYREIKKQFTADDLARFCQDEPMIPVEQFLADMEAIHERALRQRKKKKK